MQPDRPRTAPDWAWPTILQFTGVPKSAVDFGCGTGHWLDALKRFAPDVEVLGLNSSERKDAGIYLLPDQFSHADLTTPISLNRKFDVAICVELAEHLPSSAAETLVSSIARHADIVLFSGAIPGQDDPRLGVHLNEQWPDYWIERFASHGYCCFDRLRPLFWHNPDITIWYRQNIMLFMRAPRVPLVEGMDWGGAAIAHPWYFENARKHRRSISNLARFVRGRDMY